MMKSAKSAKSGVSGKSVGCFKWFLHQLNRSGAIELDNTTKTLSFALSETVLRNIDYKGQFLSFIRSCNAYNLANKGVKTGLHSISWVIPTGKMIGAGQSIENFIRECIDELPRKSKHKKTGPDKPESSESLEQNAHLVEENKRLRQENKELKDKLSHAEAELAAQRLQKRQRVAGVETDASVGESVPDSFSVVSGDVGSNAFSCFSPLTFEGSALSLSSTPFATADGLGRVLAHAAMQQPLPVQTAAERGV
jgi:regulator of replication initiation timing